MNLELAGLLKTPLHCNALLVNGGQLWCGMYEHTPGDDIRRGAVHTVDTSAALDISAWQDANLGAGLAAGQHVEGIFDLRATTDGVVLAGRTDGSVAVLKVQPGGSVALTTSVRAGDEMVTTATAVPQCRTVFATHHKGNASLVDLEAGKVTRSWKAHDFDAWNADALTATSAVVASGGDDGLLKLWDLREVGGNAAAQEEEDAVRATATARFECGVVSVVGHSTHSGIAGLGEHHLLVGTYDEMVHVMDVRALKRPQASINVGGGAWRVRPTTVPNLGGANLVVAAMHGGGVLLEVSLVGSDGAPSLEEKARFHCHKDDVLVYDAVALPDGRLASVSFYDNELCVWRVPAS
jgi:WD40 repeat protein